MNFHPISILFPSMSDEEYNALKKDIDKNGLLEPIWIYQGAVIDGRHRFKACEELRITPKTKEWTGTGSLLEFVVALNLKRRHLSSSQKAALAVELLPHLEAESKKRQGHGQTAPGKTLTAILPQALSILEGESRVQAALMTQSSPRYVSDAKTIKQVSPKLFEEVRSGNLTIPKAKRKIELDRRKNTPPIPPPSGAYNVIYADPPWEYEFSMSDRGHPKKFYGTMTLEEICEFKVPSSEDSVLFLWTTNPKLKDALQVMSAWEFEYRTNLVWVKDRIGTGYYFRGQHELLLIGKKGDFKPPLESNRPPSVLSAKRQDHSKKPDEVYELIERMYPSHSYLELFARTKRKGWESWGNEI